VALALAKGQMIMLHALWSTVKRCVDIPGDTRLDSATTDITVPANSTIGMMITGVLDLGGWQCTPTHTMAETSFINDKCQTMDIAASRAV